LVYLTGRAKDLIIRGGHNIDPAVVEESLLSHPDVTAAQAVGQPDARAGEVPVAFVTLADGATTPPDELRKWAREHSTEEAAAPRTVTVLDALPMTSVGKPYKPALRAEAMRSAIEGALDHLPGVEHIDVVVTGDVLEAVVGLGEAAHEADVKAALDQFAMSWRFDTQETR